MKGATVRKMLSLTLAPLGLALAVASAPTPAQADDTYTCEVLFALTYDGLDLNQVVCNYYGLAMFAADQYPDLTLEDWDDVADASIDACQRGMRAQAKAGLETSKNWDQVNKAGCGSLPGSSRTACLHHVRSHQKEHRACWKQISKDLHLACENYGDCS